jgi:hypothetical protein
MTPLETGARNQKDKVIEIYSNQWWIRDKRTNTTVGFVVRQLTPILSRPNDKVKNVASAMIPNMG